MKLQIFRLICAINGALMLGLGIYGLFSPMPALQLMSGMLIPEHPAIVSLVRMHVATDLGLGLGFLLVSVRPVQSLPAFLLCLVANFSHGLVHVLEEAHGMHYPEHLHAIAGLVGITLVLAVTYPWQAGMQAWWASTPHTVSAG